LLMILANDFYITQNNTFFLGRIDGIILLVLFAIFLLYLYKSIKEDRKIVKKQFKEEQQGGKSPLWKDIIWVIGGLVGLLLGGKLFIDGANQFAILAGVSELFIGVFIAAVGTSLPELIVTIQAARKNHGDITVGNIVGSIIFNILFALGLPALIKPIPINPAVIAVDGMFLIVMVLLFLFFATSNKKIKRYQGAILVASYLIYGIFLFIRL